MCRAWKDVQSSCNKVLNWGGLDKNGSDRYAFPTCTGFDFRQTQLKSPGQIA